MMMVKAQPHDFLLVARQFLDELHQPRDALLALELHEWRERFAALVLKFLRLDVNVAVFLFQALERAIAADREKPLRQVPFDGLLLLVVKAHERLLHHVARALDLSHDAHRILQEGALVAFEGALHPGGFFLGFSKHRRGGF